jgi:Bacterial Ig-like domain
VHKTDREIGPGLFALPIRPTPPALEPLFEGRPVGHCGALESLPIGHGSAKKVPSFTQLVFGPSPSPSQGGIVQVGPYQVGIAQERDTNVQVPGNVTYEAVSKRAIFDPSNALRSGTYYRATINTGVRDTSGNGLPMNKTWDFRVG